VVTLQVQIAMQEEAIAPLTPYPRAIQPEP